MLACKQSADLFLPCNTDLSLGSGKPRKKVGRRNEPEALKVSLLRVLVAVKKGVPEDT